MKVSLHWAQQYSNVPLAKSKDQLLDKIGAQLGAIEEVEEWGPRFDGIVVAKVISCVKHPNADKLHVCLIDDGKAVKNAARNSDGYVQVVCGAPNVKAGMLVAWLPPGTTVPSTLDKEPFVLSARDFRGEMSNGMLASQQELGIGEDHSGLLEIKVEDVGKELARPGTPFKALYGLDDTVIDIENKMFTHRPDCFGLLGVARELAGIQHLHFKSPDWYTRQPAFDTAKELPLEVKVEDKKLVPRFMAVALSDVKVGPSPVWMQAGLVRVGIRPINNVVDITNFVMYLTGQPLHAYDYHKLLNVSGAKTASLEARPSKKGEKVTLLGGKEVGLQDNESAVIASHGKAVGIGGVMGGADTEVDAETKNIVLECANFDMYEIRRASMKYGLFTDAVTRFNKGQSVLQTDRVIAQAIELLAMLAGAKVASKVHDVHAPLKSTDTVSVTADFVNERLGTKLSLKEMAQLLENVEFVIKSVPADKKRLHVQAPFWRTDIEIPEDIVEEIGRLYGYDHLPLVLPRRDLTPPEPNALLQFQQAIREFLSGAGANELLTYNFVHGKLFEQTGQNGKNAFKLNNALSPELQYYRMSMLPGLLDKVHSNIKASYSNFALFEMGTVHNKDLLDKDGLPIEERRLGFVFAADSKKANEFSGAPYYQARRYADLLAERLGLTLVYEAAKEYQPKMEVGKAALAPFAKNRAAIVRTSDGTLIGELGEFTPRVRNNLKLPAFVAGFEFDVLAMLKQAAGQKYMPLSRFPKVEQDMSLKVEKTLHYGELASFLETQLAERKPEDCAVQLSALDIYQPEDSEYKHMTFRIAVTSYERTLTAQMVNDLLDETAAEAKNVFGAERL